MIGLSGCDGPAEKTTSSGAEDGSEHARGSDEHAGDADGEHHRGGEHEAGERREESGGSLQRDAQLDQTRSGVRLLLAYDAKAQLFRGSIENTTTQMIPAVRVEVHLSSGKELGPTTPVDLEPGVKVPVELKPSSDKFERWSAHAEVGRGDRDAGEWARDHKDAKK